MIHSKFLCARDFIEALRISDSPEADFADEILQAIDRFEDRSEIEALEKAISESEDMKTELEDKVAALEKDIENLESDLEDAQAVIEELQKIPDNLEYDL